MIYHITNRTLGRAIHGAVIPTLSVVIFNIHSCLEGEVVGGVDFKMPWGLCYI